MAGELPSEISRHYLFPSKTTKNPDQKLQQPYNRGDWIMSDLSKRYVRNFSSNNANDTNQHSLLLPMVTSHHIITPTILPAQNNNNYSNSNNNNNSNNLSTVDQKKQFRHYLKSNKNLYLIVLSLALIFLFTFSSVHYYQQIQQQQQQKRTQSLQEQNDHLTNTEKIVTTTGGENLKNTKNLQSTTTNTVTTTITTTQVSIVAPILSDTQLSKQLSFISDTISQFLHLVSLTINENDEKKSEKHELMVELLFVMSINEDNAEELIHHITNKRFEVNNRLHSKKNVNQTLKKTKKNGKHSSDRFTIRHVALESKEEATNLKAMNRAVRLSAFENVLFYPYGVSRKMVHVDGSSNTANEIESLSSESWLIQVLRHHAKNNARGITGAMVLLNDQRNEIHSAGLSVALADDDKPTLFHRFEGFSHLYRPAWNSLDSGSSSRQREQSMTVVAVPLAGMIMSKSLFNELGGFDEKLDVFETVAVADLCLRALKLDRAVRYDPSYSNVYVLNSGPLSAAEEQLGSSEETLDISSIHSTVLDEFMNRHGDYLKKVADDRIEVNSKVVWDFGGGSCTGWFLEAQQYCVSLESRVHLRVITGRHDMCEGLPKSSIKAMDRMISRNLHNIDIFITHKPPERYPQFPYNGLVKIRGIPRYVVGRSMFESSSLPISWPSIINKKVDEVWVPSLFNEATFLKHGVDKSKVVHVPEPIDVHLYDPAITTPLFPRKKRFNFLSVFKWEDRKGPHELLEAYFSAFTKEDDVCLNLVTYIFLDRNGRKKWRVQQEIDDIIDDLNLDRSKLPAYNVITDIIDTVDMPRMYKSFDAYVLPSKGEGWGLPYIEAMSMSLPTIGTKYGGQLDFMNADNSYLIETSGMKKSGTFDSLPIINMDHLRKLMRQVYDDPKQGETKGQIAREHIVKNFSQQVISDMVLGHIKRIQTKLDKDKPK